MTPSFPALVARRLGVSAAASSLLFALGCARTAGGTHAPTPARSPRAALRAYVDSLADQPKFRTAQWGILVVDPVARDTIYSRNAGKLFMPASNQKILTGAVALHQLGPDFRFRTAFAATGPVENGTLRGDLVVIGRGDPSVSDHMRRDAMLGLREVADSLRARGVQRVTGRLLGRTDAFPDANLGFGWSWSDLDYGYSAGVSPLYFNEGVVDLYVRGGSAPGDPVTVTTKPARSFPRVRVTATTVARPPVGGRPLPLDAMHDSTTPGTVIVSGMVAVGDSVVLEMAQRDPAAAYLAALREALLDAGITVGDAAVATGALPNGTGATPTRLDTLFVMASPPLREVLAALEKPSQNQIAEIFLKTLGLERAGEGSADSGRRILRDQLLAWGAQPDGFRIRDGSGLSRYNVVTPETIVHVLDAIRADTAFRVFYDALPIAGVDGTIASRMRGTAAAGNVRAKTGSIDLARSLSGYVTTRDGRLLIFSILANNWTTPASEVTGVADLIAARLAELSAAELGRDARVANGAP